MSWFLIVPHPDDLPSVGISSGWVTANSLCHPADIVFHLMLPGWLNSGCYLIRVSYGNIIMSPRWQTLPLSHPDEIANFDFSHVVALRGFRSEYLYQLWRGSIWWKESYCADTIPLSDIAKSWADRPWIPCVTVKNHHTHHNTPSLSGVYLCQVWKWSLQWKESYGADVIFSPVFWQSHE